MTRSVVELALAAGLMEGEGSVRINRPTRRNKGHLVVSLVNTNREIVDWFQSRWPGYCKPATGLREGQRPAWVWTIACRQALAFLREIAPYVITWRMRERIQTATWWQEIKAKHHAYRTETDYEEAFNCFHWMGELNARGVRPTAAQHRK